MTFEVIELRDPAEAAAHAGEHLAARPADHNLLLSILDQRRKVDFGGRFWVVRDGTDVVGFASQSPPGVRVTLSRMGEHASRALADAIEAPVPGVFADAADAAAFAGRFTEHHHARVTKVDAGRLYELGPLESVTTAPGTSRLATAADRSTLTEWVLAFAGDTGTSADYAQEIVDLETATGQIEVWDDNGLASMVRASAPAAGVTRVRGVYTPPELRGAGYATACVEHLSRALTARGLRCVLYTDLGNPTSNAIYRRIGYLPIVEILGYDFA